MSLIPNIVATVLVVGMGVATVPAQDGGTREGTATGRGTPTGQRAAAGQGPKAEYVATVAGMRISASELEALCEPKLARIRSDEFAVKERVLDERIAELLVLAEANRRGMSVERLLQTEVEGKTRPVTSDEARAVYESDRQRFGSSEDAAIAAVAGAMHRQRVAQRRTEYVRELRERHGVRVFLEPPRVAEISAVDGPSKGPKDAPVTIVEFSDFECPYCARMSQTLRSFLQTHGSKVRLVFKHYPSSAHRNAAGAAEAAACAEEQNRFWEMHDSLFGSVHALSPSDTRRYAVAIGLDLSKFDECISTGRGADRVTRDRVDATRYGVGNTPTFFVNGRFFLGAAPLDELSRLVEEELGRMKPESGGPDQAR